MNHGPFEAHSMQTGRWLRLRGASEQLATSACSGSASTGVPCLEYFLCGLTLSVQDAATGAPVMDRASVLIKDGGYVESYDYLGALPRTSRRLQDLLTDWEAPSARPTEPRCCFLAWSSITRATAERSVSERTRRISLLDR